MTQAAFPAFDLDAKYSAETGPIFLTGTQALVRLALMQHARDRRAGLNTAGYISGYRGSPLGVYDQALARARQHLDKANIHFQPGLNEDLAATAVWGTQQVGLAGDAKYDGVFGIWYGKGPGVDRSTDALRHANSFGTARHGGVLAIAGDDVAANSSTVAAQVDYVFQAVSIPVFAPAHLQDVLDLGMHGFALSRFAGLWVGMRCVSDMIESATVVESDPHRVQVTLPDGVDMPEGGPWLRWPEGTFRAVEERLVRHKLPAALAYARANRLDRPTWDHPEASLGIIAVGKAWVDTMQALSDLGIDRTMAGRLGIRVYKVAMPWPLEPIGMREFASGVKELLVIEEKRPLVEEQVKGLLYQDVNRPVVTGKSDEYGQPLLASHGELSPAIVAGVIAQRLVAHGRVLPAQAQQRLDSLAGRTSVGAARKFEVIARTPYFCSGCPHNTSTRVPDGSRALAGIGCSTMSIFMDRSTATFTHMGAEGASWVGQAPFVKARHAFQNLGDGTYNHSGSLSIRHAVATRTNITFKILFNDAVAMTGGQVHEGGLTSRKIISQVLAEGVERVAVVTDEPAKYAAEALPARTTLHHRRDLDAVQRELREVPGVTVLLYDQACAAEKRRKRKRGDYPQGQRRAFINEAVCEGCGDCSTKSNCVSIVPRHTLLGRKRAVDQSSCNVDLSCVDGFCPSFVTVDGAQPRRRGRVELPPLPGLPAPPAHHVGVRAWSILITGVGGTGVVTLGQLLGTAAHLEGRPVTVLDMAGLAQKGGAVASHVRIDRGPGDEVIGPRIGPQSVDALIGCDLVVSASPDTLARLKPGAARAVVNSAEIPTGDFVRQRDMHFPAADMREAVATSCVAQGAQFADASGIALSLFGDAIAANLFMLGFAFQHGLVPIGADAIERAIELNGVAVDQSRAAFGWGRLLASDAAAVETQLRRLAPKAEVGTLQTLDELIEHRSGLLEAYQDAAYASRYLALVDRVRTAEAPLGSTQLTRAVAENFHRLMAYKDEYEVARLHTDPGFLEQLEATFAPGGRLRFHLAPPLLARRNAKGEPEKREFGAWILPVFRLLARMRGLRGTSWDPFGRTAERRMERALIEQYEQDLQWALPRLGPESVDQMLKLARLPAAIRGFGPIKEKAAREAAVVRAELMQALRAPSPSSDRSASAARLAA